MAPSGSERPPPRPGGTSALASGVAAAPPDNSLETRAGLVLVASGDRLPVAHPFERATVIIGRAEDADVRLWDTSSSQQHARVDFKGGVWVIRDIGSSNGTYVDGVRIQAAELAPSSLVMVGNNLFKFVRAAIESYAHYDIDGTVRGRPFVDEAGGDGMGAIVGGYRMHRLARRLRRLASGSVTVALAGEAGTEKGCCARQLHAWSGRKGGFVEMSTAGFDRESLAFAVASRLSELADGTLFLDNAEVLAPVDVLSLERLLASGPATLVLGVRPGASHTEPGDLGAGAADPDPYVVTIPPLRERKEDLRALCRAILERLGAPDVEVDFKFLLALAHDDFAGNVEELERIVASALSQRRGTRLGKEELPRRLRVTMSRVFRTRGG